MTTLLTIGFLAMSIVAAVAIYHGHKISKKMNSEQFRQDIFSQVACENHRIYLQTREAENGRN